MIMDKDAIVTAMEMLISEDFYHTQYGILFDTMIELYNKGLPVDLVTLQNKLKEKDVPPEIASLEFVRDLVTAVPTSANVKYYAQIVKDNSMRRKLIKLNEEIENECYVGKESVETVMDHREEGIRPSLHPRRRRRLRADPAGCYECPREDRERGKDFRNGYRNTDRIY